eukprot:scaffold216173_cov36-Prasinocladus_malaysianus.AAC.1
METLQDLVSHGRVLVRFELTKYLVTVDGLYTNHQPPKNNCWKPPTRLDDAERPVIAAVPAVTPMRGPNIQSPREKLPPAAAAFPAAHKNPYSSTLDHDWQPIS